MSNRFDMPDTSVTPVYGMGYGMGGLSNPDISAAGRVVRLKPMSDDVEEPGTWFDIPPEVPPMLTTHQDRVRTWLAISAHTAPSYDAMLITYGDVAAIIGSCAQAVGRTLDAIADYDKVLGLPTLAALLVNAESRIPSIGWFRYFHGIETMDEVTDEMLWHWREQVIGVRRLYGREGAVR